MTFHDEMVEKLTEMQGLLGRKHCCDEDCIDFMFAWMKSMDELWAIEKMYFKDVVQVIQE